MNPSGSLLRREEKKRSDLSFLQTQWVSFWLLPDRESDWCLRLAFKFPWNKRENNHFFRLHPLKHSHRRNKQQRWCREPQGWEGKETGGTREDLKCLYSLFLSIMINDRPTSCFTLSGLWHQPPATATGSSCVTTIITKESSFKGLTDN